MAGVPASEMSATIAPVDKYDNTDSIASCSVCSFATISRSGDAPMRFNNEPLWRVSSQQIIVAARNTAAPRGDKSSRFPIGVATNHRPA